MKKTNRIKVIALLVTVVMLLQALGTSAIITTSAATEPLYETKFNETFDTLKTGDVWGVETKRNPSKASEPTVADGVMKFDKKDSVKFTWTKVDGAGAYSSSNKYVFEFDVKITNSGEGFEWDNASYTRAMYVAFGGWYTDADYTTKVTQLPKGSEGNVTLYAKWTPREYTVLFQLPDGTTRIVQNVQYGTDVKVPKLNNAFYEIPMYSRDLDNITGDTIIQVSYVNIILVYVAIVLLAIVVIFILVLNHLKKKNTIKETRRKYREKVEKIKDKYRWY